jgi:hypothetical protein
MSDITPSSIKTTPELEEALKNANTPDEMKAILADAAVRQGLVTRDFYDPSVLLANDRAATPTKLSKAITGENGQQLFFEGESEAEIDQRILAYLREHTRPVETKTEVRPRDEKGQFTRVDNDPAAKAELELKFKRGEISTEEYLAESGAIDSYLESQGISIKDVKQLADRAYESNWESATQEFLSRHPDWEGGEAALKEAGNTLLALHLENSPSVESLESAYQDMKRRNAVPSNPDLDARRELHDKMANANSVEEIRSIGSSLFGRR